MILRFSSLARYSDLIALIVAMLLLLGIASRTSVETTRPGLVEGATAIHVARVA